MQDLYNAVYMEAQRHSHTLTLELEDGLPEIVADRERVLGCIVQAAREAGSNPCPPMVLGVGIGGDFELCAALAKQALCRPLDRPNPDPYYAEMERDALASVNALGIGPQGFGGATTCLGVAIETYPTHIAGLPVAVNVGCHVTRHASVIL